MCQSLRKCNAHPEGLHQETLTRHHHRAQTPGDTTKCDNLKLVLSDVSKELTPSTNILVWCNARGMPLNPRLFSWPQITPKRLNSPP
eukprot:1158176-Pelagomonas_calceolata.AAC.5